MNHGWFADSAVLFIQKFFCIDLERADHNYRLFALLIIPFFEPARDLSFDCVEWHCWSHYLLKLLLKRFLRLFSHFTLLDEFKVINLTVFLDLQVLLQGLQLLLFASLYLMKLRRELLDLFDFLDESAHLMINQVLAVLHFNYLLMHRVKKLIFHLVGFKYSASDIINIFGESCWMSCCDMRSSRFLLLLWQLTVTLTLFSLLVINFCFCLVFFGLILLLIFFDSSFAILLILAHFSSLFILLIETKNKAKNSLYSNKKNDELLLIYPDFYLNH